MWVVSNDTAYPVFSNSLKFDPELRNLVPHLARIGELRFGPFVAILLLLNGSAGIAGVLTDNFSITPGQAGQ